MKNSKRLNQKSVSDESRRKSLKNILTSGGVVSASAALPSVWTKPVVDTVLLPGHAATTESGGEPGEGETTVSYFRVIQGNQEQGAIDPIQKPTFVERVLDTVVPNAIANHRINQFDQLYVCVSVTEGMFTLRLVRYDGNLIYDYGGVIGTVGVSTPINAPIQICSASNSPANAITATVDMVTPANLRVTLVTVNDTGVVSEIIPAGDCATASENCPMPM